MSASFPRLGALLLPLAAAACATSSQSTPAPSAPTPVAAAPGATQASAVPARTDAVAAGAPRERAPQPTVAEITADDLRSRLYVFAADSMLGRQAGGPGGVKAADYLAREAQRLGLQPAGENGSYFQTVPLVRRGLAPDAALAVAGDNVALGTEARVVTYELPGTSFGSLLVGERIPVVYGGSVNAIGITAEQARGKLVVLSPVTGPDGKPMTGPNGRPLPLFWSQGPVKPDYAPLAGAAGIAFMVLDAMPSNIAAVISGSATTLAADDTAAAGGPLALMITPALAERMLGSAPAALQPGAAGRTVRANLDVRGRPTPFPARNVVALLPGSDPALRGQYVVIGAHSDHVGTDTALVEHDSLRAFNTVYRPGGADSPPTLPAPTAEQQARFRTVLDSLRALRPARVDTVFNGADDDGSGSVAVLEIAESLAKQPTAPRRSTLFVWHTAEELGLYGAQYYADHPTVPRDSIVTMLNIDMLGRGGADDLPQAGSGYLQLIGSKRLSTELGDLVERVNREQNFGMRFDYQFDATGHPLQYYCRSDHYEYAKYGIPVTFFTTGGHRDYHQLTDEPQYVNYPQLANAARFIRAVGLEVLDADRAPRVDQPVPALGTPCRQ